ncbi:MAG: HopJ type III effector protein [Methylococcales bacterium]|nr:HopJ type III effector protein [Methylococcales bacterium]
MTHTALLNAFLQRIASGDSPRFAETLALIEQCYHYQPTAFDNGLGEGQVHNDANSNQGSCKVFSFAKAHDLSEQQTLQLFGEHHQHVLETPEGSDHANIRAFMRHGWAGICWHGQALTPKT